jgi:DnaJ-class molecular chaperone
MGYETWSEEIPCAACDGTGNLLGGTCIECRGDGIIHADSHVVCELCQGTGEVSANPAA